MTEQRLSGCNTFLRKMCHLLTTHKSSLSSTNFPATIWPMSFAGIGENPCPTTKDWCKIVAKMEGKTLFIARLAWDATGEAVIVQEGTSNGFSGAKKSWECEAVWLVVILRLLHCKLLLLWRKQQFFFSSHFQVRNWKKSKGIGLKHVYVQASSFDRLFFAEHFDT